MREICICRSSAIIKNQDEKRKEKLLTIGQFIKERGNDESDGKPQVFDTSTYVY